MKVAGRATTAAEFTIGTLADVRLDELLDVGLLEAMLRQGMVRVADDPTGRLRIYDYTKRAQGTRTWNAVTDVCRGLVVDADGAVVARPFPRFVDLRQLGDVAAPFDATEKLDGSLAIHVGGGEFATRGSFTSEQARHASDLWRRRYSGVSVPDGETWCFEVVYPANRIVVDNGPVDELVLLAALDIESGADRGGDGWPGPRPRRWPHLTSIEELPHLGGGVHEGWVLQLADGRRAKVKTAAYRERHDLLEGASALSVWAGLRDGNPLSAAADRVGLDNLAVWARRIEDDLCEQHRRIEGEARAVVRSIRDRAEIAVHPNADIIFAVADGKPVAGRIWRRLRPTTAAAFPGAGRRSTGRRHDDPGEQRAPVG